MLDQLTPGYVENIIDSNIQSHVGPQIAFKAGDFDSLPVNRETAYHQVATISSAEKTRLSHICGHAGRFGKALNFMHDARKRRRLTGADTQIIGVGITVDIGDPREKVHQRLDHEDK